MKNRIKNNKISRRRFLNRQRNGRCMFCSYPAKRGDVKCEAHQDMTINFASLKTRRPNLPNKRGAIL